MKSVNAFVLFLAGAGMLGIGNRLSEQNGVVDSLGVAMGIAGNLLMLYAIIRSLRSAYLWTKEKFGS